MVSTFSYYLVAVDFIGFKFCAGIHVFFIPAHSLFDIIPNILFVVIRLLDSS